MRTKKLSADQKISAAKLAVYQKQQREIKRASAPNQYNGCILDQLYITRASYVAHFTARSIRLLGYNPYKDGVYAFESPADESRFMYYWCCGHGIQDGMNYHAALLVEQALA